MNNILGTRAALLPFSRFENPDLSDLRGQGVHWSCCTCRAADTAAGTMRRSRTGVVLKPEFRSRRSRFRQSVLNRCRDLGDCAVSCLLCLRIRSDETKDGDCRSCAPFQQLIALVLGMI